MSLSLYVVVRVQDWIQCDCLGHGLCGLESDSISLQERESKPGIQQKALVDTLAVCYSSNKQGEALPTHLKQNVGARAVFCSCLFQNVYHVWRFHLCCAQFIMSHCWSSFTNEDADSEIPSSFCKVIQLVSDPLEPSAYFSLILPVSSTVLGPVHSM